MTNMSDLRKKSTEELTALVSEARGTLRTERFKDKFSKKASVIVAAKLDIARAMTELTKRRTTNAK